VSRLAEPKAQATLTSLAAATPIRIQVRVAGRAGGRVRVDFPPQLGHRLASATADTVARRLAAIVSPPRSREGRTPYATTLALVSDGVLAGFPTPRSSHRPSVGKPSLNRRLTNASVARRG
jgi:hypothetical protein